MASDLQTLRDTLAQKIRDARMSSVGGLPSFESVDSMFAAVDVQGSWNPRSSVEQLKADARIWVIGLAYDDAENLDRNNLTTRTIPIQIAIQAALPQDGDRLDSEISKWVQLDEIVRDLIRHRDTPPDAYTWLRTESLKDPNGTPFAFSGLRQGSFYESYFTAYFKVVVQ